jgi:hypothetical protein
MAGSRAALSGTAQFSEAPARATGHVPGSGPRPVAGTDPGGTDAELLAGLRALPELEEGRSRWADVPAFLLGRLEIVHLHGDEVEIRLTRRLIRALDDERVWQRARESDWVALPASERELALELTRNAIDAATDVRSAGPRRANQRNQEP